MILQLVEIDVQNKSLLELLKSFVSTHMVSTFIQGLLRKLVSLLLILANIDTLPNMLRLLTNRIQSLHRILSDHSFNMSNKRNL